MRRFEQIAAEQFKIPVEEVNDALTPKDIPDWDSMTHLLLIAELENEYTVTFTMDELLNAASLGAIRTLLKNKGVAV